MSCKSIVLPPIQENLANNNNKEAAYNAKLNEFSVNSVDGRTHELLKAAKYKFIRTLGRGNFAKVKLAKHIITQKEVAIKIIDKSRLSPLTRQKLYREVKIMKCLNHPNIVKLFEIIENDKFLYLVMEYVSGGEVLDYLVTRGFLKENEARLKFRQIVSAVQYCHKKKIAHRDLKTENILLDNEMNIKIADFGLSNEFSTDSQLNTFCGSPPYASPELFKGIKYFGPEVDIWALGVILYTLVSGYFPFDGPSTVGIKQRVLEGKYRTPVRMTPECNYLIGKMLDVNPLNRYTIDDVMKDRWINIGFEENPLVPFIEPSANYHDPVRTELMINMGFTQAEIQNSLTIGNFDIISATYFILENNKTVNSNSGCQGNGALSRQTPARESTKPIYTVNYNNNTVTDKSISISTTANHDSTKSQKRPESDSTQKDGRNVSDDNSASIATNPTKPAGGKKHKKKPAGKSDKFCCIL